VTVALCWRILFHCGSVGFFSGIGCPAKCDTNNKTADIEFLKAVHFGDKIREQRGTAANMYSVGNRLSKVMSTLGSILQDHPSITDTIGDLFMSIQRSVYSFGRFLFNFEQLLAVFHGFLKNLDTHNGEQIHNASTFNGVSFDFE
jgi:hypothetical protein